MLRPLAASVLHRKGRWRRQWTAWDTNTNMHLFPIAEFLKFNWLGFSYMVSIGCTIDSAVLYLQHSCTGSYFSKLSKGRSQCFLV